MSHLSKAGRIWKEGSCCWSSLACFRDMARDHSHSRTRRLGYKNCGLAPLNDLLHFTCHGNDRVGIEQTLRHSFVWKACHIWHQRKTGLNFGISKSFLATCRYCKRSRLPSALRARAFLDQLLVACCKCHT